MDFGLRGARALAHSWRVAPVVAMSSIKIIFFGDCPQWRRAKAFWRFAFLWAGFSILAWGWVFLVRIKISLATGIFNCLDIS